MGIAQASVERHLRTHTAFSAEDAAAVTTLEMFLRSNGKINTNFARNDKWPNIDGTFEFVSDPQLSRRPMQNFFVQIKGTHVYRIIDGCVHYSLKSLAFPAYLCRTVTLDPGILFLITDPDCCGRERVFWKYMSATFLNSIDYDKESATLTFTSDEEIQNTDESVAAFCKKLEGIVDQHAFISRLEKVLYSKKDALRMIQLCNTEICTCIEQMNILNETRDNVSQRLLRRLEDLCTAVMLLDTLGEDTATINVPLAWAYASLSPDIRYLSIFFKELKYIGRRIPEEGQAERLMLRYYDFLWQIRRLLWTKYRVQTLQNLEAFPLQRDELDQTYYELVAKAVERIGQQHSPLSKARYYIQKRTPFFVGTERYYELTLQLADVNATKYNRVTVYSKLDIVTPYSICVGYENTTIHLWGIENGIKVVTGWTVSIAPACLNALAKILRFNDVRLNARYGEYMALMQFLTETGMDLLEIIDLSEELFEATLTRIYEKTNTAHTKQILTYLKQHYAQDSNECGRNVIRYLLIHLRGET